MTNKIEEQTIELSRWQTKVWKDPSRYKVLNLGRRSGKTLLSIIRLIYEATQKKCTVWYVSPTYRQSKEIAWLMLKNYTPTLAKPKFNESELKCTLENGSVIALKGADHPDSLRGTKVSFMVLDEIAFFKEWYNVMEALRPILIDEKAPVWYVSTPNGLNHFYHLYKKQESNKDYKSFHHTSFDNPYISSEELHKIKEDMDEDSYRQEILAEFVRPSGTVYSKWPVDNYVDIDYDENLPLHLSWDFGVNDPTAIIWIQPNKGETRIIDYYEASNADLNHFIQLVKSKPYKTPEFVTGDIAGNARELTTGKSPIDILRSAGIHVKTSKIPSIEHQIRLTHQYIRHTYVGYKAERFRDILLNYRYPEKRHGTINQSNEKPIHDEWSHGARAFEYWCWNKSSQTEKLKKPDKTTGQILLENSGVAWRLKMR